jgi:hypothetical protein
MDRTHAARSEANAGLASSRRMGERYSDEEEEEEMEKENERNGFVCFDFPDINFSFLIKKNQIKSNPIKPFPPSPIPPQPRPARACGRAEARRVRACAQGRA